MALEIRYHRYQLFPKARLNSASDHTGPREGLLLSIGGGYSALHPLPEFGDPSVDEHLSLISEGKSSVLLERALHYLDLDRSARSRGESCFKDLEIPESHVLLIDGKMPANEKPLHCVKVKIRDSSPQSANLIEFYSQISDAVRLDANAGLSYDEACELLSAISSPALKKIEFFEDPIPYASTTWSSLFERFGVPLALDLADEQSGGDGYHVRVIKPLRQQAEEVAKSEVSKGKKLVVTTSLDHPLGQSIAAFEAARIRKNFPHQLLKCGLLSHVAYESNQFSEALQVRDGRLIPAGTGFGFDHLLSRIPWAKI